MDTTEKSLERAESLKKQANDVFAEKDYDTAYKLYTDALECCPEENKKLRAVLLNNCAAAQSHLTDEPLEEARTLMIARCSEALELDPDYLKPLVRRAKLYREIGEDKLDEALADYKRIVELDPSNNEAKREIVHLEEEIKVRNEKMKDEMLSKLKDLGNLVLKPFGLSTQNFALNPNESGGYSVNFKPSG